LIFAVAPFWRPLSFEFDAAPFGLSQRVPKLDAHCEIKERVNGKHRDHPENDCKDYVSDIRLDVHYGSSQGEADSGGGAATGL
jgi:hypothetical protein